ARSSTGAGWTTGGTLTGAKADTTAGSFAGPAVLTSGRDVEPTSGRGVEATSGRDAEMTATTELTGTVSPSLARISATTPAAGAGISASTLSVEISNNGSSRSTRSPTFLSHRTIVPSAIDSPIWGITTSAILNS